MYCSIEIYDFFHCNEILSFCMIQNSNANYGFGKAASKSGYLAVLLNAFNKSFISFL